MVDLTDHTTVDKYMPKACTGLIGKRKSRLNVAGRIFPNWITALLEPAAHQHTST